MKKIKIILCMMLLLVPTTVLAAGNAIDPILPFAILWEAFASIHMSVFFLSPLANLISEEGEEKKTFWKLFIARACILLIFDFFITPYIFIFDFFLIFAGVIIIVPILSLILKKKPFEGSISSNTSLTIPNIEIKCAKCGTILAPDDNYCRACGAFASGNKVVIPNKSGSAIMYTEFDEIYKQSDNALLEEFIKRELVKANIDEGTNLIPKNVLRKKKVMIIIFSLLLITFISSIFFHFPMITYIIFLAIILIMYKVVNNYDFMKYLKKEIKSRPSEKMSNIVMSVKSSFVKDDSKASFLGCVIVSVIIPMILFFSPKIMYEDVGDGYYVRYYIFGINNFKTATIPDTYKGKPVLGLRGNTFSNMFFLERVTLPDTIKEIRGQAFKNDRRLKEVKLPSELTYLGGGSFYNCSSLTKIELPDTITYMGGETFKNATSLKYVKLSNQLTEIRGNTFENCQSLQTIDIPDTVTRIGGHAFYGCSNLSKVNLSEKSKLLEIGSSAFRLCDNLMTITLPKGTSVNERAFKESPTTIKRFGDYTTKGVIDTSKYSKKASAYLSLKSGAYIINPYSSKYEIYKAEITLVETNKWNYLNTFTLKYAYKGKEETFTLTADNPYKYINENILVYVDEAYFTVGYSKTLHLNIYYN